MRNHSVAADFLSLSVLYTLKCYKKQNKPNFAYLIPREQLYKETTMAEAIKRALHSLKPDNQENTPTQQMSSQTQSMSDSQKSKDLSSMTVERQFDTDYDKAGNLVPDPVHFDPKEQDMVRASLDDFSDH